MKNLTTILALVLLISLGASWNGTCYAQNVGINNNGAAPNNKAMLDIDVSPGNNKGLLVPRMATSERDAIAPPIPESLLIYNTTTQCYEGYNATTSQWVSFGCIGCQIPAAAGSITGTTTVCLNQTGVAYSINSVPNATGYAWAYSGSGFTIATGANTNSITANFSGTTPGNLTVYATSACGNGTSSPAYAITVSTAPSSAPTAGTHVPSTTQIVWNWNAVSGATGYKWNTTNNYNSATDNGPGTSLTQSGLTCNTSSTIYVWAYNCSGNSTAATFTQNTSGCYCTVNSTCNGDITDSRGGGYPNTSGTYTTVQIGSQCWMAQNLNVGTRVNGSVNQSSGADDQNTSIQKYCQNNNEAYCTAYGGLYQWNEMMAYGGSLSGNGPGPQGICPTGWHLPTDNEWKCLQMNLGMSQAQADMFATYVGTDEGGKLKESGTGNWNSPNTGATNSSGFTGLGAGYRYTNGSLLDAGNYGWFWTATAEVSNSTSFYRILRQDSEQIVYNSGAIGVGVSVRCVKD